MGRLEAFTVRLCVRLLLYDGVTVRSVCGYLLWVACTALCWTLDTCLGAPWDVLAFGRDEIWLGDLIFVCWQTLE